MLPAFARARKHNIWTREVTWDFSQSLKNVWTVRLFSGPPLCQSNFLAFTVSPFFQSHVREERERRMEESKYNICKLFLHPYLRILMINKDIGRMCRLKKREQSHVDTNPVLSSAHVNSAVWPTSSSCLQTSKVDRPLILFAPSTSPAGRKNNGKMKL